MTLAGFGVRAVFVAVFFAFAGDALFFFSVAARSAFSADFAAAVAFFVALLPAQELVTLDSKGPLVQLKLMFKAGSASDPVGRDAFPAHAVDADTLRLGEACLRDADPGPALRRKLVDQLDDLARALRVQGIGGN